MRYVIGLERLARHGHLDATTGCLVWDGACDGEGYGIIRVGSRRDSSRRIERVHRAAYAALVEPIPAGCELDHTCRVRRCFNPRHLDPVTHAVNVARGASPIAAQAAQTHCLRGHELDGSNTYAWRGHRYCRACRAIRESRRGSGSRSLGTIVSLHGGA